MNCRCLSSFSSFPFLPSSKLRGLCGTGAFSRPRVFYSLKAQTQALLLSFRIRHPRVGLVPHALHVLFLYWILAVSDLHVALYLLVYPPLSHSRNADNKDTCWISVFDIPSFDSLPFICLSQSNLGILFQKYCLGLVLLCQLHCVWIDCWYILFARSWIRFSYSLSYSRNVLQLCALPATRSTSDTLLVPLSGPIAAAQTQGGPVPCNVFRCHVSLA